MKEREITLSRSGCGNWCWRDIWIRFGGHGGGSIGGARFSCNGWWWCDVVWVEFRIRSVIRGVRVRIRVLVFGIGVCVCVGGLNMRLRRLITATTHIVDFRRIGFSISIQTKFRNVNTCVGLEFKYQNDFILFSQNRLIIIFTTLLFNSTIFLDLAVAYLHFLFKYKQNLF